MKRSWATIIAYFGLIVLLVVLGVLQYMGLRQISESDREKARGRVQEQTDRFAADFNREIQGAYFNFQTDADSWKKGDWTEFNERYDYWKEKTSYPELISDFYFLPSSGAEALHYDAKARAFVAAAGSRELDDLKSKFSDAEKFEPIQADVLTLALPVHNAGNTKELIVLRPTTDKTSIPRLQGMDRYGVLAIRLSEDTIRGKLVPDLTAKYFGDGEYNVSVKLAADAASNAPDATASLFDLSPSNIIQYANKDALRSIGADRRVDGVVMDSQVIRRSSGDVSLTARGPETFHIEMKGGPELKTRIFSRTSSSPTAGWTLLVQHAAGSLDEYIASTFRRNLAIGFGILLLLAAAVGTIIYSAQRAKNLARRQVEFVSSVSHEFRTPLAVICSAGENLSDGVTTELAHVSRYGDLIKGEGRKLSRMVEQILDFAGADSGRKKYNFSSVTIADVVDDALAECGPMIDENGVEVLTDVSSTLAPISADRGALSGAIQNLIFNSIKYSGGNKWLRIAAQNGGSSVRISVEDHGIGISKKDLKQIFDPFYRSREVVDAQIHGNGLGLSLVKQIAEAHGGRVRAESELEKGSKFTIELPIRST